jgi:hypothetical protein
VHFDITRAAKNRATLRRVKGNGRSLVAAGAKNGDFDSLFDAGGLSRADCSYPVVFVAFAVTAAFRRILQTFIAEKNLLADRPEKFPSAVDAGNLSVVKIGFVRANFLLRFFKNIELNV